MIADDAGNYLKVNQAAAKMFGYPLEKILQMNVGDLQTTSSHDAAMFIRNILPKVMKSESLILCVRINRGQLHSIRRCGFVKIF